MKLLTTTQIAQILDISRRRVRALITSGRLPAEKVGRDWIVKKQNLKKVAVRKIGRPKQK